MSHNVGISKLIKTKGEGTKKPRMGDTLLVSYFVTLEDGSVLASGEKKEVTVGQRQLWGTPGDIGLRSMLVGERATITGLFEFADPHPRINLDVRLHAIVAEWSPGFSPSERRLIMVLGMIFVTIVLLFLYKEGVFS